MEPTRRGAERPLRLWPGVTIVALILLLRFGVPLLPFDVGPVWAFAALLGPLVFVLWWVLFSRAPWSERLGGVAVMALAVVAVRSLVHRSIATSGMGVSYFVHVLPILCLGFLAWAAFGRRRTGVRRWLTMAAAAFAACAVVLPLRTSGISGDGFQEFEWRWTPTPEQRLLAQAEETTANGPAQTAIEAVRWPGFRGPSRDGVVAPASRGGVEIATDWAAAPPVELWRRPIGPGWSSFAVAGDRIYTQEQRGEEEAVSCYALATGELVWRRLDPVRFWEANAGAGPRATPTVHDGVVYSLGATGLLNALDAADGNVLWARDTTADTGAKVPDWGFSGSPLVVDELVVVHAGALMAYERAGGTPRWQGELDGSYSSPQLATLGGVPQILMLSGAGASGVAPSDGGLLWRFSWEDGGGGIVQPALTADGDVLVSGTSMSGGAGLRRVAVTREGGLGAGAELRGAAGWGVEERWTSRGLKPYFSDFVVHEGHAYGFDGRILAAIDLESGERRWKGGRYGSGQLVLLPRQDLLLVVSEKGELALVRASPEGFTELARRPAIEGKTWNHPVLVDDLLLVRNGQEMAAYRLARAAG